MAFITLPDSLFTVDSLNSKHYLKVDAYYGSTHSTTFLNIEGKLITVSNTNPDGLLGIGSALKGKSLQVATVAQGDIDTLGPERVKLIFYIDDQTNSKLIMKYDKSEAEDATPFLMFNIIFS